MINKILLYSTAVLFTISAQHPEVVRGSAHFSKGKKLFEIKTDSSQTYLKWKELNVPKGETLRFVQPSCDSATLNRVLTNPTKILGTLESNGHIFLLNPNGIVVGKEGKVSAQSSLLSTHQIDSPDHYFGKQEMLFTGSGGEIVNLGTIEGVSGNVYLIANQVKNSGCVSAKSGHVAIGCGNKILITPNKSEKLAILTDVESAGLVENSGRLEGKGVTIKAQNNPYSLAIRHTGIIDATEVNSTDSGVFLIAEKARVLVEEKGKILAPGSQVQLLGHEVYLKDESVIDVSSNQGAGSVYIGGGFQGKEPQLLNSKITYMGENAKISANSYESGNGGTIVLWSDGVTGFFGSLSAEAGANCGDGGLIEVSGVENLIPRGKTSTRAPSGKLGMTLYDPTDITISAAATSGGAFVGGVFVPSAGSANILNTDLYSELNSSNVTINTSSAFAGSGDISFTAAFDYNATAGGGGLTLIADQDINVSADTDFTFVLTDNNSMTFTAARDINISDNLLVENLQNFTMTATTGDVNVSTATNLDCNNTVQININAGNNFFIGNSTTLPGQINTGTSGTITITAGNDATILGRIENNINGDISLTATRDVKIGPSTTPTNGQSRSRIGTLFGDVTVIAGRDLILEAGDTNDDAFAQIGFNAPSIDSDIYLTVGRDLTLISATGNTGADDGFALIGHGGSAGNTAGLKEGDIIINSIGRDLTLTARGLTGQTECFTQIGHTHVDDADVVTLRGDIRGPTPGSYVPITGKVTLQGGVEVQAYALIGHGGSNVTGNLFLEGNILIEADEFEINGGVDQDTAAGIGFRTRFSGGSPRTCTISDASVKVKSTGEINLVAGNAGGASGAAFIGGYVNTTSNARFGAIDISEIDVQAGTNLNLLGGLSAANENLAIIGAKTVNTIANPNTSPGTSRSSLTITTGGDFNVTSRNGEAAIVQNGDTPTPGRTFLLNIGRDFLLFGQDEGVLVNAIDTGTINVGRNLSLYSGTEDTTINAESTLNVTASQDILLFGQNFGMTFSEALIHNQSGDLTVKAGRDITLQPFGSIRTEGTGDTAIVVDNRFPSSPSVGPGEFSMNANSSVGSVGGPTLRIFTADRTQNSISDLALINGTTFVPGTLFVDSATEIWQTYFPSSLGGTPFTIFYKNGPSSSSTLPNLITILNEDPRFFFANYEMFWKPFYRYFLLGQLPDSPWPNVNCQVECAQEGDTSCSCPSSLQPYQE
ncbi:MAG: filamentous hemagglutinin N-terminal domain-containing protein [Candidatus Algichlamydia australiensis]|nr:filamentous hemagglutinin N-terminal domain-containing protein [Chlamydiales bacterium]